MNTKIKIYQVDAFTNNLFSGNPAAVCLLDNWLPDEVMQAIALENNLSETAFLVKKKDKFFLILWGCYRLFISFKYYRKSKTRRNL